MITKIKRLKSIGKFYDFSGEEDALDWHKNTFVFAPNAYGKTTLVNVLRSLRDNVPELISARKTLGVATKPETTIVIDEAEHVFKGTKWGMPYPAIQIFDVDFIHENILLADEISINHRKNIHKIIVGAEGVALAKGLEELKSRRKLQQQELEKLTKEFKGGGFKLSLDDLLFIPPADEASVDSRIHTLEQNIESKNSETVVRGLDHPQRLRNIPNAPIDLSTAGIVATQKLPSVHEAAEKQVLAHIDCNFKDKIQAMQFIRRGMDFRQKDCPFCGQDLKNATDLLKAYREFFDDSYLKYQQSVAEQLVALSGWNIDNELTALVSTHNSNLAALKQWKPYLGTIVLQDIVATVNPCRVRLVELKGKVQSELEKKQKNPNADADLSQFEALTTELARLKTAVEGYNAEVFSFIEKAKQCIANLPKSDVDVLQVELDKEKEIKKRFEPAWKRFYTDYTAAKKVFKDLTDQQNAKQKELETSSKAIFDTYQGRINELLERLGTDFTITGLTGKTDARATASHSDFSFLILKHPVPLTTKQNDAPCFKNTLSEGDKSTLAFAFFIASLEKNRELDRQIVIFDDPLSSLDETRRDATARLLLDLSPTINQLNVFTHKWDFLDMLCEKGKTNKVLHIHSDRKNGSRLKVCNMAEERKSPHARTLEKMARYIEEDFESPGTMQGNIRKIFETVLKTKYHLVLNEDNKSSMHNLEKIVNTLCTKGLLDKKLKEEVLRLNKKANKAHHGEIVDAAPTTLSRDELIPLIKQALDLIHKV